MNVGVIDADLIGRKKHRFPNLALMKLSAHHKSAGDNVSLLETYNNLERFDKVYIAKAFTDTEVPWYVLDMPNVEYGGTGFFYDCAEQLPDEIEHSTPDYGLYSRWAEGIPASDRSYYDKYSIGFTTRGCVRGCLFCVNKNSRESAAHSPVSEFIDASRPKICLLDDNIFAHRGWRSIFDELTETKKPFRYHQGLDIRLMDEARGLALIGAKYDGDHTFAFDDINDYDLIERRLKLYNSLGGHRARFYVFCGFDRDDVYSDEFWESDIINLFRRIELLGSLGAIPYVMRHENYKNSRWSGLYTTIARWCNQPQFFKKLSLEQFSAADDRDSSTNRINMAMSEIPETTSYITRRLFSPTK